MSKLGIWLSGALLTISMMANAEGLFNLADSQPEFLPVDEAFVLTFSQVDSEQIQLHFDIADGYYLYKKKFHFTVTPDGAAVVSNPVLPPGQVEDDPTIGITEIYREALDLAVSVVPTGASGAVVTLTVQYQGCADAGLCYAPETRYYELTTIPVKAVVDVKEGSPAAPVGTGSSVATSSLGWMLLGAFAAGIALSLTPCVLPLIPIVTAVVVGEGSSFRRGLTLSSVYVAGTATTYAAAGALAGATGGQLQAYFQSAWSIGLFAFLLVLLALGMFGLFSIQLPSGLQGRLSEALRRFRPRSYAGVYLLGVVSALVVGACVGPLVVGVLAVAMERGDPLLGAELMFSMAWGMGLLLIAAGSGTALLLPKAGAWMSVVSRLLGVLLLVAAIQLLTALPAVPVLLLWGVLLIVCGVYLGATRAQQADAGGWQKLLQGVGLVLLIWGAAALIGGLMGQRELFHPLPVSGSGGAQSVTGELPFLRLSTVAELEQQLTQARNLGQPVMVDYYADWCTDCKRMEGSTFTEPQLHAALAGFSLLRLDVTANDLESTRLKQRFGVFGPPALAWVDRTGRQRQELTLYGYQKAPALIQQATQLSGMGGEGGV